MAIRIITDSTADFTPAEGKKKGIEIVPLKVIFSDQEYLDGVDISNEEFYQKLCSSQTLPTTSQPTPNDFIQYFEDAKEANDDVVAILLSSELSGTFQSAKLAQNVVEYDRIFLIDSLNAATSLKLLVEQAISLREEGCTAEQIVEKIQDLIPRVSIKAIVSTLDYLVKGGRLSKAAGFAGTLLSIKPLISVIDGKVEVIAKARGKHKALETLWQEVEKDGGIDLSMPVLLGYTQDDALAEEMNQLLQEKGIQTEGKSSIGSAIGTHAGPGACAIAYFKK